MSEDVCEGKFYPKEMQLEILETNPGKKFLTSCSKKNGIEARINWLEKAIVLKGLPKDNERFYAELEQFLKRKEEAKRLNVLDVCQQLPRNRRELINFMDNSLAQLDKNLGNVVEIFRKLKIYQDYPANFYKAERLRRILNIILFGQAGFREGPMHLSIIRDKMKQLQADVDKEIEVIPENQREELEKHWRYIFSSQIHANYDQLIRQYLQLKRGHRDEGNCLSNQFQRPAAPNQFIFNNQQRGNFQQPVASYPQAPSFRNINIQQGIAQRIPQSAPGPIRRQPQQRFHQSPPTYLPNPAQKWLEPQNRQQSKLQPPFYHRRPNAPMQHQYDDEEGQPFTETPQMTSDQEQPSSHWSKQCVKQIARCMAVTGLPTPIKNKLFVLLQQARSDMLTMKHFQEIKNIYFNLLQN